MFHESANDSGYKNDDHYKLLSGSAFKGKAVRTAIQIADYVNGMTDRFIVEVHRISVSCDSFGLELTDKKKFPFNFIHYIEIFVHIFFRSRNRGLISSCKFYPLIIIVMFFSHFSFVHTRSIR